jgi:hypothetical protein
MAAVLQANKLITEWLADSPSAEITTIEKSVDGRVTIEEISDSLREYANLFKAGYSSPAQTLTLHRAYPDNPLYAETVKGQDLLQKDPNVVGGPASVEMIDREGHLITTNALSKAFDQYMKNPMTRNVMVMHSDIQVGWALPAYISKSGQIYKSGIGDNTLFFITELRDDTKISKRVVEEIKKSRMKSYSIAGSAIRTENVSGNMFKGEPPYMRVDELELAEVTICEKGVNQGAGFDIIKSNRPTKSCADGSCFISKNEDHSHKQETQTMSFDEYKNLLTSRDGKSFTKMFSEYAYVYKGRGPLDRLTGGRAKVEWNTQSPLNPEGNPKLINPKNVVELQITPKGNKEDIKKSLLSILLKEDSDHKKAARAKFMVGQKRMGKTDEEANANFERSYNPDRPNKSAAPKAATGKRAKINPADNSVPAKQLRGNMTEEYMRGLHSPEKMKGWMKQYGIDPRNIPHHGHMVLSPDQHKAAATRRKKLEGERQARFAPKASSSEAPRSAIIGEPVKISEEKEESPIEIAGKAEEARERARKAVGGESAAERARKAVGGDPIETDMFGQPVTDSDTKKAMKSDMLYTLLGIGR